ncbi:MAG TPA: ATP-binding protein [Geomonas sp.]|nr:ATP-binding protein [Geomonas sp.]
MIKAFYRFFIHLSFRSLLILLVLLLSLPAVALITYSGYQQRRDSLKEGITEARMLVRSIATEQDNLTSDAQQLASALAQLPDVRQHRPSTSAVLASMLKLNQEYGNIVIADRAGEIWASALPFRNTFTVKGSRAFEQAVQSRRFVSGEYGVGRISGKPNISFGFPVLDDHGGVDSVILVSVNFVFLNELLVETGLPKGSSFTITDRNGVIIYRNVPSGEPIGARLKQSLLRQMQTGSDDSALTDDGMISSFQRLRLPGEAVPYLYVKAGIPVRDTLVKARRAQFVSVLLLSPVLLVAVLLATLLAKFCFVNRIRTLQEAAQRLARGELDSRVSDLVRGGELGELGRSFDQMAEKLAARELELIELNQSLAQRVEEETERRLQQERLLARHARLAAIGEMIGAIAHQWRQPLATLGAIVQSLRMAWDRRALDERFLERAESDAQKQLYYMSDTIEDFRNFFSPEKVVESFDVREKLREVSLLVAAQFANSGVALEVLDEASGLPLKIRGYQNEFKQSVLNLVSNAFDAVVSRWGKGKRAGEGSPGKVVISLAAEKGGRGVVIEVRDNGCGIASDIADKVWEPYFTSKPDGQGTGIGLYMSKLIIEESMGGSVGFRSLPEGTSFRIVLPRDEID